jgi:hypothetical protein
MGGSVVGCIMIRVFDYFGISFYDKYKRWIVQYRFPSQKFLSDFQSSNLSWMSAASGVW